MRPTRAFFLSVTLVLAAAILPAQDLPEHRVHLPDGERPPVLEQASLVDGLVALTLGASGTRAAVATFDPEAKRSTVQLFSEGEDGPRVIAMTGRVRDVLFAPDGDTVYALLARETKKRVADTQLMSIDFARAKSRSVMRVPPTASAIDLWHERNSLIIASHDAIRTVVIPEIRSGPLFAVPGQNLSVVSIGGTSRLLVGQGDALLEVDLNDPPGETSLPIRDRVATSQPVVALAAATDGGHALARMSDGTLTLIRFDPLRIREVGRAEAIAELETTPPAPETVPPARSESQPPVAPVEPAPEDPASPAAAAALAVPEPEPAAPTPVVTPDATGFTVSGRIVGPSADAVLAVVFLGPDNLLREAARVRPWADGNWEIHVTQPGRYRVQLDGGGAKVLVSEPSFRLIELGDDDVPATMEFKVLRVL